MLLFSGIRLLGCKIHVRHLAAAARVLSHYFGEDTAITVTSDALPGQARSFLNFSSALEEIVNARVSGIHFRTDCEAGQALGKSVAEDVIKHSLRRLDGCDWGDDRRFEGRH